jgi:uncharacterized protein (DUF433 family)
MWMKTCFAGRSACCLKVNRSRTFSSFSKPPGPTRSPPSERFFRLTRSLVEALRERARARGESANALAERLLEEGLRREEHPLIAFRDGAAGRRAALVGTRLDVWQVIDTLRNSANSVADTAAYLQLPEAWVQATVRYYAAHPDEVDRFAERVKAAAEREQELWLRQQAVLG